MEDSLGHVHHGGDPVLGTFTDQSHGVDEDTISVRMNQENYSALTFSTGIGLFKFHLELDFNFSFISFSSLSLSMM